MKVPLTRSWMPLLLAALFVPAVIARGASDPAIPIPQSSAMASLTNSVLIWATLEGRIAGRSIPMDRALRARRLPHSPSQGTSNAVSEVRSDVALAGSYSRLTVGHNGEVDGDRYEQTTSSETHTGNGIIGGSRISNASTDSLLNGGVTSLKNVSNSAFGLAATAGSPTKISLTGGSMTISNNPFGGKMS